MGGQLVFDWDRLGNFLITHDRPVGNVVTDTKYQSWVSHVQMQCTIALVNDAQTEGKVSVTHKSSLPRNNRKTYYHTFAASTELAQARNQLGTLGGAKSFPKGAQNFWTMSNIFKLCPTYFSRRDEIFFKLHTFTIFYTMIYSQCNKIYFLCFINWLNAGALLQLADAGGIGHMTRTISSD